MSTTDEDRTTTAARTPLSRGRVLESAVDFVDEQGLDALSMRKLANLLGVDPMSLYNHVANKEDLLDGMVDVVVGRIGPSPGGGDWKATLRAKILSAREAMMSHPWAAQVLQTRASAPQATMQHYEEVAGILRDGGFSVDLVHHALHVLGSRLLGFSQELFDDGAALAEGPEVLALQAHRMAADFPNLSAMMLQISHDEATVVGSGCDDLFEFEFALDLILDGLERRRDADT